MEPAMRLSTAVLITVSLLGSFVLATTVVVAQTASTRLNQQPTLPGQAEFEQSAKESQAWFENVVGNILEGVPRPDQPSRPKQRP